MQPFDFVSSTIAPMLSRPVPCGPYWLFVAPAPLAYPFVDPRRLHTAACYRHLVRSRHGLNASVLNVRGLPGGERAKYDVKDIQGYVCRLTRLPKGYACIIHCYHGMHRTGLVFCAALMQVEHLSLEEAWQMFCNVRPCLGYPMRENIRLGLKAWESAFRPRETMKK